MHWLVSFLHDILIRFRYVLFYINWNIYVLITVTKRYWENWLDLRNTFDRILMTAMYMFNATYKSVY